MGGGLNSRDQFIPLRQPGLESFFMSRWLNIGEILRVNAQLFPESPGLGDLDRTLTFRQWNERACRLARALMNLGLAPGDRAAVLAYNCLEFMEIYLAAAKAGLTAVPVMFRLAAPEIAHVLKDSEARVLIVGREFVETVEGIRGDLHELEHLVLLGGGELPCGYLDYEELMGLGAAEEPEVKVRPRDVWTILYTSGTTGRPKGVVRTHESYIASFLLHAVELGFTRDDHALIVMPLCHINSIVYALSFTYVRGRASIYHRMPFDPEHLLKTMAEKRITFSSLVPTHYVGLLGLPDRVKNKYDLSAVGKLQCSSAPSRTASKGQIMSLFRNAELYEGYGSTEAGLVTLLRPEDQLAKPGSIGREIFGTDRVRLLDEDGREVGDGETGELFSRGPGVFSNYFHLSEESLAAFRGEYFSAGDLARRDSDGYYYLVDRKKNMIITGGENVYPSEVEEVLLTHPAVGEAAVIGVPDPKWGEAVTAYVVPSPGVVQDPALGREIMEYCRGRIAGYKRPKSIRFIAETDLPRNPGGKILHRALRQRAFDNQGE